MPSRPQQPDAPAWAHSHRSGPRRRRTPLLDRLDAEWEVLRHRRIHLRCASAWPEMLERDGHTDAAATLGHVLTAARGLDDLLDATQPIDRPDRPGPRIRRATATPNPHPEEVMAALLRVAAVDDLAARVVVQRILPGVIAGAKKWTDERLDETVDQAVVTCWAVVRQYDSTRQPACIAAALVHDVMWQAFRKESRRRSSTEVPAGVTRFAEASTNDPEPHPLVELAHVLRTAAESGVERIHLDLLRELIGAGSTDAVAARHHVTARTIRNRRAVAQQRVRDALIAA